jgi:hypothetical protein
MAKEEAGARANEAVLLEMERLKAQVEELNSQCDTLDTQLVQANQATDAERQSAAQLEKALKQKLEDAERAAKEDDEQSLQGAKVPHGVLVTAVVCAGETLWSPTLDQCTRDCC